MLFCSYVLFIDSRVGVEPIAESDESIDNVEDDAEADEEEFLDFEEEAEEEEDKASDVTSGNVNQDVELKENTCNDAAEEMTKEVGTEKEDDSVVGKKGEDEVSLDKDVADDASLEGEKQNFLYISTSTPNQTLKPPPKLGTRTSPIDPKLKKVLAKPSLKGRKPKNGPNVGEPHGDGRKGMSPSGMSATRRGLRESPSSENSKASTPSGSNTDLAEPKRTTVSTKQDQKGSQPLRTSTPDLKKPKSKVRIRADAKDPSSPQVKRKENAPHASAPKRSPAVGETKSKGMKPPVRSPAVLKEMQMSVLFPGEVSESVHEHFALS